VRLSGEDGQDCLSARWPSALFRPSAGPRGSGEGELSRARVRSRSSRWPVRHADWSSAPARKSNRSLRLTPRGARSAVGGIQACVSGIWPQGQPLTDTSYFARACVPISTSIRGFSQVSRLCARKGSMVGGRAVIGRYCSNLAQAPAGNCCLSLTSRAVLSQRRQKRRHRRAPPSFAEVLIGGQS
jgi:hypothetical protein